VPERAAAQIRLMDGKQQVSMMRPSETLNREPSQAYSSEVQQPMRATAVLGSHQHTRWAALFDREQGRAASLHPEGQGSSSLSSTPFLNTCTRCRAVRCSSEDRPGQLRNASRHQWRTYASHPSTALGTSLGAPYDQAPINRRCILLVQRLDRIEPDDDAGRRVG
jgi:hypothetical protein